MTECPQRIAVCQHPNGEGVWWDADRHGPGCIQDCDCTPEVYLRGATTQGIVKALEAIRDHGKVEGHECWALHQGDCADVFHEIARSALDQLGVEQ